MKFKSLARSFIILGGISCFHLAAFANSGDPLDYGLDDGVKPLFASSKDFNEYLIDKYNSADAKHWYYFDFHQCSSSRDKQVYSCKEGYLELVSKKQESDGSQNARYRVLQKPLSMTRGNDYPDFQAMNETGGFDDKFLFLYGDRLNDKELAEWQNSNKTAFLAKASKLLQGEGLKVKSIPVSSCRFNAKSKFSCDDVVLLHHSDSTKCYPKKMEITFGKNWAMSKYWKSNLRIRMFHPGNAIVATSCAKLG